MKAFCIGDLHGCFNELLELLEQVPKNTQIFSVGDLIDRGPDSRKVINFIRDSNIQAVRGNHESMAIECLLDLKKYVENPNPSTMYALGNSDWFYNGGHEVFNQYKTTNDLPQLVKDIEWMQTLPLFIKTGIKNLDGLELLVSHTWSALNPETSSTFDMLWNRNQPYKVKNTTPYYNIYGHTPVDYVMPETYHKKETTERIPKPLLFNGAANIDTGAPYNSRSRGVLTGIFFPSLKTLQVQRKPYSSLKTET